MENRLPSKYIYKCRLWNATYLLVLCLFLISTLRVSAQQSAFTINYTGPDTLYVGGDCEAVLDWGHPGTVNISTVSGVAMSTTTINTITGGHAIGDRVSANQEILITYYAEDVNGVNGILTNTPIKVYIADTLAPLFQIVGLPNDTSYNYLSEILPAASLAGVMVGDNCGLATIEYEGESPRPSACTGGTFTRTWAAVDDAGNRSSYQQTITLNPEDTAPTWLSNPSDLIISCATNVPLDTLIANWLNSAGGGVAIDSSGLNITNDFTSLSNGCGVTGTATVVFMAIDSCGNSIPRTADIMVTDNTPPTFDILPRDTMVDCLNPSISLTAWMNNHGGGRASDVCNTIDNFPSSTDWSVTRIDTTNTCGNEVIYEVVFQVEDACGNIDSAMASYSIIDTLPPIVHGLISDTTLTCSSPNKTNQLEQWLISVRNQSFQDACSGNATLSQAAISDEAGNTAMWTSPGSALIFPIADFDCDAAITVAFTFADACGNLAIDTAVFALLDTIAPVFTNIPTDITVECNAIPDTARNVVVTDNCDTSLVINYKEIYDTSAVAIALVRIWEVQDACNNIATDSQFLLLIDTTAPTLMGVPNDTLVACGDIPTVPPIDATGIFGLDNCGADVNITFKESSTQDSNPDTCTTYNYTITRTWTTTDLGNNIDSIVQVITVADTTAPNFILPVGTSIQCELKDSISQTGMPTGILDNCDPNPTLSYVDSTLLGPCQNGLAGSIFRIWRIEDVCGNIRRGTQQILLIDTIAPIFSIIPADTMVACSGDTLALPVIGVDIMAIDNCLDTVMINLVSDTTTQNARTDTCTHYNYTRIRTWEAFDACNNRSTYSQTIQVADTLAPTFILPNDTMVACELRDSLSQTGEPSSVADNCDATPAITFVDSIKPGTCAAGGVGDTLLRVWRITDVCGNSIQGTQQILLIDTLAPVFTFMPLDTMVQCTGDTVALPLIGTGITAADNCPSPPSITYLGEASTRGTLLDSCSYYNYMLIRSWEAVDACDNRSTYTQTIQVIDTIAPAFVLPRDTIIDCTFRDSLAATGEPFLVVDDCDASPLVSFKDLVVGGDCLQGEAVDTIFRTWIVTDACGNFREGIQRVILIDTLAPIIVGQLTDVTIQCTGDTIPMPVIGTDIKALDNCLNIPLLQFIGETTTQVNSEDSCGFYNYTLVRTWRATDGCNNQSEFVQTIQVVDTIAPTIICPANIQLFGDSADCSSSFKLPVPYYFDDCNGFSGRDSFTITQSFTHDTAGDLNTTPVDTLYFSFNIGGAAPQKTITDNISISIDLMSVDGEGADEYFIIVGEDGTVLGETDNSPTQCDNSLTDLIIFDGAIFNEYAADSVITFTLVPNGTGAAAINNVCTDGTASMTFQYNYEQPASNLLLTYQIDDGTEIVYPPASDIQLVGGGHRITYYAEDCSGNRSSCSIDVVIDNAGAPAFDCPEPITFHLDSVTCNAAIDLPYPENFYDNCGFINNIKVTTASFLEFSSNANAGLIPIDVLDTLLVGNVNPIGDGVLTVTLQGDVSDPGEFFNIFGENGMPLGSTSLSDSVGACVRGVMTDFAIPMDTLIAWSADGIFTITASPNQDVVNFSDFVGPCDILNEENIDLSSQISFQLAYPSVIVDYSIVSADSVVTATGFLTSSDIIATEDFLVGTNIVTYMIQDSISSTSCSFAVEVVDSIAPMIACNPSFSVATNPSGLTFSDVNSTTDSIFTVLSDNCGIADISITPTQVSCDSVGLVAATVVVTDYSGNEATCQTEIQVFAEILAPTFSLGGCDNDTLYLFADTTFLTPVNPNTVFTYQWAGPGNFISNDVNPFIPSIGAINTGSYTLTLVGATGCTTSGSVFVDVNELDIPSIQTEETSLCINEDIVLTTTTTNCDNVEYRWFEVIDRPNQPDSIAQVEITTTPRLIINDPSIGQHFYFLVISCDDCISSPSSTISVTAFEIPTANTTSPITEVCEGESIQLGALNVDPTATYSWVGPGYTSNFPNPVPITNASQANEGVYTLIVSKNACTSESDFTVVNVKSRTDRPNIANQSGALVCEGSPFILISDVTTGSAFNWTNTNTLATFTTTSPTLLIDSMSTTLAGDWTLNITSFGCESESSRSIAVAVEEKPRLVPFHTGGACKGGMIELQANPAIAGATYQWADNRGNAYFGSSPEVPVSNQYTVTVTSTNNCRTTSSLDVKVESPPVITSIFDSGDANPCVIPNETEVILAADVFPSNDGTYAYIWSLPDGTTLVPSTDSTLVVPNTNAEMGNGTYNLVVETGNGCQSAPATNVVAVTNLPTPNPSITANNATLCEGERLMLTATDYEDFTAQYHWRLPSIDTITLSPILIIDPITTAFNGLATVQVYNGGCMSLATATVNIQVTNGLPRPVIPPVDSFCEGEEINLETDLVPGAVYFWEGPDFSATSTTPSIVVSGDAEVIHTGGYTVQIQSNGCESQRASPISVEVAVIPSAPIINNNGNVCLATSSEVVLFIDQQSGVAGAAYTWFNAVTNQRLDDPTTSNTYILDVSNYQPGSYSFYAIQERKDCQSDISNITEVILQAVPTNQANVCEANLVICHPRDAIICATTPVQGTGSWTTNNSQITILDPTAAETAVEGIRPGQSYTFTWTLSDPICGNYSFANMVLRVSATGDLAQACSKVVEACDVNSIELCANALPSQFMGKWSQPQVQENLGVVIEDITNPNTRISSIEPGRPFNGYSFYWTITDIEGTCPVKDTVKVNIYDIPTMEAMVVDKDLLSCSGQAVVTAETLPTGVTGVWSSPDEDLDFGSLSNPSTLVDDLKPGENQVLWSISAGACGDYSSDLITIFYEQAPTAMEDVYSIEFSGSDVLNVTENDSLFSGDFILSIAETGTGIPMANEDGTIDYIAPVSFVGTDEFSYQLCSTTCPEECTTTKVFLNIGENAGCILPTIITPNGDGINDAFVIPCIEAGEFPQNEVSIFNQWGDEIFRAAPYENNWEGTYDGADVPVGTYYYIISFSRNKEPGTGFLIVER